MIRHNIYSMTEVVEYVTFKDADGTYRVKACRVIGHRKFINGQEVGPDGLPKDLKNATGAQFR